MLRKPREVDRKARGVGMQVLKLEETLTRKEFVGVQCSGRLDMEDIAKGSRGLSETVSGSYHSSIELAVI